MDIIGKIDNGKIIREYYGQGWIYKNYLEFEKKSNNICYIPELSTNDNEEPTLENTVTYNYSDFLDLAKGFLETNKISNEWCIKNNVTPHDIAKELFESVDWQSPETLLDEWEIHNAYTE